MPTSQDIAVSLVGKTLGPNRELIKKNKVSDAVLTEVWSCRKHRHTSEAVPEEAFRGKGFQYLREEYDMDS